jgi:hypothetical protein
MAALLLYALMLTVVGEISDMLNIARFEVFRAVTMKNAIFWDVTLCGYCKH